MRREIRLLNDFIQANMIDKTNDCTPLKAVYVGKPNGIYGESVPCVYLIPSTSNALRAQYVGEDTVTNNIVIRIYVGAMRDPDYTVDDPTPATLELIDLTETLIRYLRVDPTFKSRFVSTELGNISYKQEQSGDVNVFRYSEFTLTIISRQLWQMDGLTDDNQT